MQRSIDKKDGFKILSNLGYRVFNEFTEKKTDVTERYACEWGGALRCPLIGEHSFPLLRRIKTKTFPVLLGQIRITRKSSLLGYGSYG